MQLQPVLLAAFLGVTGTVRENVWLPVGTPDRHSTHQLVLTGIGRFGEMRKARPSVPSHLHTGIDIRRPRSNYMDEPVYPVAEGVVVSKRVDGPYAQLIIEHTFEGLHFWTVYEHIAGITVGVSSPVDPTTPIARFLNRNELQKYGWQFDHLHFEVLRARPVHLKEDALKPERYYASYTLECHTPDDLHRYFFDPLEFLDECFARPPR